MACGCPVVTTACHGNEEFCIEGKTALVRSPDDPAGLADACRRVCHDADLRAGLVANGRKMAARYRWEPVVDRLENFYARVWTA